MDSKWDLLFVRNTVINVRDRGENSKQWALACGDRYQRIILCASGRGGRGGGSMTAKRDQPRVHVGDEEK